MVVNRRIIPSSGTEEVDLLRNTRRKITALLILTSLTGLREHWLITRISENGAVRNSRQEMKKIIESGAS
jgi:hypothetical protein